MFEPSSHVFQIVSRFYFPFDQTGIRYVVRVFEVSKRYQDFTVCMLVFVREGGLKRGWAEEKVG